MGSKLWRTGDRAVVAETYKKSAVLRGETVTLGASSRLRAVPSAAARRHRARSCPTR